MKKELLIAILICFMLGTHAQNNMKTWDYPVKPGSKEWSELPDNESKVKACQIPETILKDLSTEDLFNLVLEYPLLHDMYAFNDVNAGLKKLFEDFNGARELSLRANIFDLFVERYFKLMNETSSILRNHSVRLVEKGRIIANVTTLETLSTSNYFLKKASKEEKSKILQTISVGYQIKTSMPDEFRGLSMETTEKAINLMSKELGMKTTITPKAVYSDYPINVKTPSGSNVPAWKTAESSAEQREYYDYYYSNRYPHAVKKATNDGYSSTRRFNCHGYAWHLVEHQNSPSEDCWIGYSAIENDPEKIYITDGSYNRLNYNVAGAKIVWASGDHTAVSIDNQWCTSKWNEWPLMKHRIEDSPFGKSNLQYYYYNYNLAISGPTAISSGETATYYLNNPPRGTVTWSVSNNLQIVSGQNTAQITVRTSITQIANAVISFSINTLSNSRTVDVNTLRVQRINGPTRVSSNTRLDYDAHPVYPSSMGSYIWSLSPSPYPRLTTWQNCSYFSPNGPGQYTLSCYFRTASGVSSLPVYLCVSVSNSYRIAVSEKILTIIPPEESVSSNKDANKIEYTLYSMNTGQVFDKGITNRYEKTFDYTNIPKGNYIFTIKNEDGTSESFKINL